MLSYSIYIPKELVCTLQAQKYFTGSKLGRCHIGNQTRTKDNANIMASRKTQSLCKCIDFAKRVVKTRIDVMFFHWSNSTNLLATNSPGKNCFVLKSCLEGPQEKNKDPGISFRFCRSKSDKGDYKGLL